MGWTVHESVAEQATVDWAAQQGIPQTKLNLRGRGGWPDRVFWLPLRPLLIEFKQPGEVPDPRQEDVHELLKAFEYEVQVHTAAEEAIAALAQAYAARKAELLRRGCKWAHPLGAGSLSARRRQILGAKRLRRTLP